MKLLFVGLGRMGWPMAEHLLKAGHSVKVYNRTLSKAEKWSALHGVSPHTKRDTYDAIVLCVDKDEDVESVLTRDLNLLDQLNPNGLVIDHTTTSIDLAVKMGRVAKEKHLSYYDAPVSGGEIGAQTGQLVCMMGGDESNFARAEALIAAYCKKVVRIGNIGTGQAAKMANQLCIAGTLAGLSEAIRLLEQEPELDKRKVFEAISGGAAQSWQMDQRFQTMVGGEYDFGFGIDLMLKDLGYALDRVRQQGWVADVAEQAFERYQHLSQKHDMGTCDTSGLLEYYRNRSKE